MSAASPGSAEPREAGAARDAGAPEGLSAFAAKVLDQLSVSAWLPAAALVAGLFSLLKVRFHGGDALSAMADIGDTRGSTIVLLGAAVIVLTTVTQAFEFGAIRILEGYWGFGTLSSRAADRCIRRSLERREGIVDMRARVRLEAFESARPGLAASKVSAAVIAYLAADIRDESTPSLDHAQIEELESTDWRRWSSAQSMRRLSALDRRLDRSPRANRTLPTRLGNILRSYEDVAVQYLPGSVGGMVQRIYHLLPAHVQVELDQYRNRIGLYASLVAVSAVLGAAALAIVATHVLITGLVLTAAAICASMGFYGAAISSAEAYGSLLVEGAHLIASSVATP